MELTTIFYHIDEFCKLFEKEFNGRLLSKGKGLRKKAISLSLSEVMTILSYYHQSGYKTFKDYYTKSAELKSAFPEMPSYNRFIELQQKAVMPLAIFAKLRAVGKCDGVSFVDSFSLRVSHPKRIYSHKTFSGIAARGKTSTGWFYGFKVHVVINGNGEIINFEVTPGNIADNNAIMFAKLTKKIYGKLYGDKGYIFNPILFRKFYAQGLHIITKIKANMKNKLMHAQDKFFLRKRGIVESVGAILKEDLNIEHYRYRNPITLFLNVYSAIISYAFREKKPSIYKKNAILLPS